MKCPDCGNELIFVTKSQNIKDITTRLDNFNVLKSNYSAMDLIDFKLFTTQEEINSFLDNKAHLGLLIKIGEKMLNEELKTVHSSLNTENILEYRGNIYIHTGENNAIR